MSKFPLNLRYAAAQHIFCILPQRLLQQRVFRQASVGDCPRPGVGSGGDQAAHGRKGGIVVLKNTVKNNKVAKGEAGISKNPQKASARK